MKKRHFSSTLIALGVALIFIVSGCATLNSRHKVDTYRELQGIKFRGEKVEGLFVPDKYPDFSIIKENDENSPYHFWTQSMGYGLVLLAIFSDDDKEFYGLVVGAECPVLIALYARVDGASEFYRYEEGKPIQCTEKEYQEILTTPFKCPPSEKEVFNELGRDLAELQRLVIELNKLMAQDI